MPGLCPSQLFGLAAAGPAPIADEALRRIAGLYAVEVRIRGAPPEERRHVRASHALPKVDALQAWLKAQFARVPAKSATAQAIRYALSHWAALSRYLGDGRIEIDNNAAGRGMPALRRLGLGRPPRRRHPLPVETAKLNGLDPERYVRDVLNPSPITRSTASACCPGTLQQPPEPRSPEAYDERRSRGRGDLAAPGRIGA